MEQAYKVGSVEEAVFMMDMDDLPGDIVKIADPGGEHVMVISSWWVHIPEWGINLHQGAICISEGEKIGLPDRYVTVIQEAGGKRWLYYVEAGFVLTLYHWLKGAYQEPAIKGIPCYIRKPVLEANKHKSDRREESYEMYD